MNKHLHVETRLNSFELWLDVVEFRTLCRSGKFFHTKLGKPFCDGPGFVHGGDCRYKVGSCVFKFPSLELRGYEKSRGVHLLTAL